MSDSKMPFNIEPFIPGTVPFTQYLEQLEWVFEHHKVTEDKDKKSTFMAACNREVYKEIKRLFPSEDLKKLTFKQITDALLKRYDKPVAGFIQRFQFYNRKQGYYESAEDFILDVKQHAELCDFGNFKDVAIRDRLICGMADSVLQENMFDEDDLSLARVEKLFLNREANNARKKLISGEPRRESVLNRLGRRDGNQDRNRSRSRGHDLRGRNRSRSGSFDRRKREASKKKFFCTFCRRNGHTRPYCYDLPKNKKHVKFVDEQPAVQQPSTSQQKQSRDKFNRSFTDDECDMQCLSISSVNKVNEPCFRKVVVAGLLMSMEVDCGAAVSVVCWSTYSKKLNHIPLEKCNKKLAVINDSSLKVEGQLAILVELNGQAQTVSLIVLRSVNEFVPLLGRDWLDVFFPGWRNTFGDTCQVNQLAVTADQVLADVESKFANVFDKSLATPIKGFEADLVLKDDTPIFKKAYDVPLRLRDQVCQHLESLEKDGVITPVGASEWASPVIIVVKKDGGIRMVIDCKVSINKVIIPNTYPLPLPQDLFAFLAGAKVLAGFDRGVYTVVVVKEVKKVDGDKYNQGFVFVVVCRKVLPQVQQLFRRLWSKF